METYQTNEAKTLLAQVNTFIAEKHLCSVAVERYAGTPGGKAARSRLIWLNRAIDNIFAQLDALTETETAANA